VNHGKTEAARAFEIERTIVDKNAFFGPTLSDGERDAEDAFFGFARVNVAGAEENLEASAKIKGFDAVLIQFERLVVDGADEVFLGFCDGIEDGA
jgi:hypothetical protein